MTNFQQMFALALVLVAAAQVCSANNPDYELVVGYGAVAATIVAGPGSATSDLTIANFSSVLVFDSLITETPNPKSKAIGNLRGSATYVGRNVPKALLVNSFDFIDKSGSLIFSGSVDTQPNGVTQIIGGDGKYLFAKGFGELKTTNRIFKFTIKYKKASKDYLQKWN